MGSQKTMNAENDGPKVARMEQNSLENQKAVPHHTERRFSARERWAA
jgi:hypothetical protein